MKTIGLVGCGNWGVNILRDLLQLQCKVVVADIDERVKSRALAMGAADFCLTADELPVCDGYVVAVPIPDLTKVSFRLLQHRKPIFAEKTLCLSMADCHLLKKAGGSQYIYCMHKWHYHPGIEALRCVAHSGRIGQLEQVIATRHAWVSDFHGGDVFWTQSVHDLTIIKHILGEIPRNVQAIHVIKNEQGLPISFTAMMGNNPAVLLSVSGRHCNRVSGISIHGSKGTAELYNAYDDHVTLRNDCGEEKIPIDTTFPLFLELREFAGYLAGGPAPRCNLENAKEVTQAILRLRKKARLQP